MITVSVNSAQFFSYHGFYPEEQVLGCRFEVDAEVSFKLNNELNDNLLSTVNYEQLYQIMEEEMKNTRKLIETVAQAIADGIKNKFPFSGRIAVRLRKLNPPLNGPVKFSTVEILLEL